MQDDGDKEVEIDETNYYNKGYKVEVGKFVTTPVNSIELNLLVWWIIDAIVVGGALSCSVMHYGIPSLASWCSH